MLCGLGEECTKFRKEKMEKEKNSMRLKVYVGMKKYLTTYNHVKYFSPYLNRFEYNRFLHQTFEVVFAY